MLVDQEIARALVAEQTLHELFVSFDGSKKATLERIRRGADYDKILANIEYLTRLKKDSGLPYPRVALRYVITLSNIEEMPEIFEICARLGIYKVEVVYLNVPNESDFEESLFNHQDLAAKVFPQARRQAWRFGIRLSLPPLPNDHDRGSKCMYPWRFCQIDTDGSIRFCYHSWRQRLGFIEDGFESIWRGEHYRKIRLTVDSEQPYYPHCRVCSVRRGFGLESSHRKDFESDSYVIAGLEKLQVPFTERAEENLSSFREIKAKRASFEQQGREAADFPRE
jgi:MoaA/NifB/PqqE/SkfB family radical SAM enzyme